MIAKILTFAFLILGYVCNLRCRKTYKLLVINVVSLIHRMTNLVPNNPKSAF